MRNDLPVDDILAALSDPVRRRMLDLIADRGEATATMLAKAVDITRQGVTKHLMVLERAELVVWRKAGREVLPAIKERDNGAQEAKAKRLLWMRAEPERAQ